MRLCLEKALDSREFYSFQGGVLHYGYVPVERCSRKTIDKIIYNELIRCPDYHRIFRDRDCLLRKIHSLSQKDLNVLCFCFRTNSELYRNLNGTRKN